MAAYQPFLGTTTDRNQAFPGIKALKVTVVQDPYGYYCKEPWQRTAVYSKQTIPRYIPCKNPRCQQSEIDLQQLVFLQGSGTHTIHCEGHEGTPKGRRKGAPCDNVFTITIDVTKEEDARRRNDGP